MGAPSWPVNPDLRRANLLMDYRLVLALEHLDNHVSPKPEPYDRSTGLILSSFLAIFEEYCQHSFRGCDSLWVGELGQFLTGEARHALYAQHGPSDSYIVIKTKLLMWYEGSKQRHEAGSKAMFTKAVRAPDESVRLFGSLPD